MKLSRPLIVLVACLAFAPAAAARQHHPRSYLPRRHHACRAGYRRERVAVRERRHGRLVRRHHRVVWVRQVWCVADRHHKAGSRPASVSYATHVDPTFTQAADNPLAVTYQYSASATAIVNGVTTDLAATGQLPAGILDFYTQQVPGGPQSLVCSMNVGGELTGGACPVTYQQTGTYEVTTQYIPDAASAVTETDTETISPYATSTSEQVSATAPSGPFDAYSIIVSPSVLDPGGNPLTPAAGSEQVTVADLTNHTSSTFVGSGTLTLAVQRDDGGPAEVGPVGYNYRGYGGGGDLNDVVHGDQLQITSAYLGSPGYAPSASPAQALTAQAQ